MAHMTLLQRKLRHMTAVEQARQRGVFAATKNPNPTHRLPADPTPRDTTSGFRAYRDHNGVSLPYLDFTHDRYS